ncbi:MAG: hypothetical protein KF805_02805 [Phycisphaeraceae bacterium]|nr:hypothetical protein [Phycisphaeraceae bacterium]
MFHLTRFGRTELCFFPAAIAFSAGVLGIAGAAAPACAFTFTLTPVTNTTPNFAGTILITGTVSMGAGETFIGPNTMSSVFLPFKPAFTAGFNGPGQTWDAGFLAWNGLGTYTGAIYNHQINAGNLGYSGGMPLGLYNFNPLGPSGQQPAIILWYLDPNGVDRSATATYAINVVPAPGALATIALGGLVALRRRRR